MSSKTQLPPTQPTRSTQSRYLLKRPSSLHTVDSVLCTCHFVSFRDLHRSSSEPRAPPDDVQVGGSFRRDSPSQASKWKFSNMTSSRRVLTGFFRRRRVCVVSRPSAIHLLYVMWINILPIEMHNSLFSTPVFFLSFFPREFSLLCSAAHPSLLELSAVVGWFNVISLFPLAARGGSPVEGVYWKSTLYFRARDCSRSLTFKLRAKFSESWTGLKFSQFWN